MAVGPDRARLCARLRAASPRAAVARLAAAVVVVGTALAAVTQAGSVVGPHVVGPAPTSRLPAARTDALRSSGTCGAIVPSVLGSGWARGELTYCTDFPGRRLPAGWDHFSGVPGGDPSGRFLPSHVTVRGNVLTLTAARDARLGGRWGTGGVCQCGAPRTFGAFFVRSRVTGVGPDEIDLLWPVAHMWPPEIDFNESAAHVDTTTWTVHYGVTDHVVNGGRHVDLEAWHTWGVVWTRRSVRLLVDGRTWGMVTTRRDIPTQPMTLDISQQTFCGITAECPSRTVHMEVDWVAEYSIR